MDAYGVRGGDAVRWNAELIAIRVGQLRAALQLRDAMPKPIHPRWELRR